jgi:hypothetical protein
MKQTFIILAILAVAYIGCKKDPGNGPTKGTGATGSTGNTGGTGNTGSTLAFTALSPAVPYADQEITIIGTGFDPNTANDKVSFVEIDTSGKGTSQALAARVISATSTQLVIKAIDSASVDEYFHYYNLYPASKPGIQVTVNGKSFAKVVKLANMISIVGFTDPQAPFGAQMGYDGDSLFVKTNGPVPAGSTLTIGQNTFPIKISTKVTPGYFTQSTLYTYIPKTYFGNTNVDSVTKKNVVIKITLPDGKTEKSTYSFLVSPHMEIYSISASEGTYTGLATSGGDIKIHVVGRNLKSDAIMYIGNGVVGFHSNLAVSDFPDSTDVSFNGKSTPAGNYSATLERPDIYDPTGIYLLGGCQFTVLP